MAGSSFSRLSYSSYANWAPGMRGLMNYSLSCCVNALLQSFSATWELMDVLDKWKPVDVERKNNVPLQLRGVLKAMQSDQSQPAPHRDFLHCLDRNYIRLGVQQDADEVFLSILNLIQKQMNNDALAQEIQCLYKMTMETHLQCIECTYIDSGTTFLLSLPLPISEGNNSLEDCIKSFFEIQELRGSEMCYCERCGQKMPTKQGFKLISLPPVVCLHLKRFRSSRSSRGYTRKLNCEVTFPETLDFSQILTAESFSESYVKNDCRYSLCAVIVHIGDAMFGHYTAFVRHKGDQSWFHADDSCVRQVSWKDIQRTYGGYERVGTAYMLLYRRNTEEKLQECSG